VSWAIEMKGLLAAAGLCPGWHCAACLPLSVEPAGRCRPAWAIEGAIVTTPAVRLSPPAHTAPREGSEVNWKKLYRIYKEERLTVRKRGGRKRARARGRRWRSRRIRISAGASTSCLTRWSTGAGSVSCASSTTSAGNAWPRSSITRSRANGWLANWTGSPNDRGYPCMVVSDNGTELTSNAMLEVAGGAPCRVALHRAGQAHAERLRGELQRTPPGRMPQRASVPQLPSCPRDHRGMAYRLQYRPTPQRDRQQAADFAHERLIGGCRHLSPDTPKIPARGGPKKGCTSQT
jgi:hypothetical protein